MTWKFHQESSDRVPNRDFLELNKMSVFNGSISAHVTFISTLRICINLDKLMMQD